MKSIAVTARETARTTSVALTRTASRGRIASPGLIAGQHQAAVGLQRRADDEEADQPGEEADRDRDHDRAVQVPHRGQQAARPRAG